MDDWLSQHRIRTIVAIVEEGSFSRAAARLKVGRPSISQQVRRLEDELGHPLFARNKRGLTLTSDGEAYLVFARAVLGLSESARRHFQRPSASGNLHLGVSEEFARTKIMQVLLAFKRLFPKYKISVTCDTSYRLLIDADEGRYDVVVSKGPTARMRGNVICRVPLVWVGTSSMDLPVKDPVPLILPPQPDPFRALIIQTLQEAGRTWDVRFETTDLSAMEAAVKAGFGLSIACKRVPLSGIIQLDHHAGLPMLPDHDIIFLCKTMDPADEGVHAMRSIIEHVFNEQPDAYRQMG